MGKLTDMLKKILCSKKIKEDHICWQTYAVSKENVICFNLSSNPLLGVAHQGQLYFFRECPPKMARTQYVQLGIHRFFAYLDHNQVEKLNFSQELPIEISFDGQTVEAFSAYMENRKEDSAFLLKLSGAYEILNRAGYSIWAEDNELPGTLFEQIGLADLPENLYGIGRYFAWCMRAMMACLDTQKAASGKERYYYNALRSFGTEILAEHLGAGTLVTRSVWCRLDIDGDVRYGVLSKAAAGKRAADVKGDLQGSVQRDLISLHVLDALCFQQDHGPNNYNLTENPDAAVCAFDNDNPNTFFPLHTVSMSLAGCAPLVENGRLCRPYISETFAQNLLELDRKALSNALKPWLNGIQRIAVLSRLWQLQTALKNGETVLLKDEEWNEKTLQKELTGDYGKTYLTKLSEQMN